jgi:PAS domain S-box-containing protein
MLPVGTDADFERNGFLRILLVEEDDVRAFVAQCELSRLERPCSVQRVSSLEELAVSVGRFKPAVVILGERVSEPERVREVRAGGVTLPLICVLREEEVDGATGLMNAGANDCILSSQLAFIGQCVRNNVEAENSRGLFCQEFQAGERGYLNSEAGANGGWKQWEQWQERFGLWRARVSARGYWEEKGERARQRWREFQSFCGAVWQKLKVRYLVGLAELIARQKAKGALKKGEPVSAEERIEIEDFAAKERLDPAGIVETRLQRAAKGRGEHRGEMDLKREFKVDREFDSTPVDEVEFATEREDAFHSLELAFKALFHTAFDAILLVDNASAILHANAAAATLLGSRTADLLGRKLLAFAAKGCATEVESEWEMLLTLASHQGELRLQLAEGEERVVEFRGRTNLWFGVHLIVLRMMPEMREVETNFGAVQQDSLRDDGKAN